MIGRASAQRKDAPALGAAPPPVVARELNLRVGETVPVKLGIHGARGQQLQFLIRSSPKLGKLSDVRTTALNAAVVSYTAGQKAGADRFTYAVESAEGISAPGVVSITISEPEMPPARLALPEKLEFPPVILGQRSSAGLEIKNVGGAPAEGEVTVPPPWRIEGAFRYRLKAGETVRVGILFEPEKEGAASGEAIVARQPLRVVSLAGEASEALAFTPATLALEASPGSRTRKGVLKISNRSDEDRSVRLTAGKRLITGSTVTVPAKSTVEVPVFAEAGVVGAFDEKLQLASDRWSAEVPVRAVAMGAMLGITKVELPREPIAGVPAVAGVVVANSGADDANVIVRADPPMEASGGSTLVAAGKSATLAVSVPNPKAGNFTGKITIEGAGQTLQQTVSFKVAEAEEAGAASVPVRPPNPTPVEAPATHLPNIIMAAEHPNARGRLGRATSPTTAVIEWPADFGATKGLVLKRRTLSLDDKRALRESWVDGPRVVFKNAGEKMRAEISRLEPGTLHTLRVVDSGGGAVLTVSIGTPARPPFIDIGWRGISLILLVATLAGFSWWKWKTRARTGW